MKLRKKTKFRIDGDGKSLQVNVFSEKVKILANKMYDDNGEVKEDFFYSGVKELLRDDTVTSGDMDLVDELDTIDILQIWLEIDRFIKKETEKALKSTEYSEEERETANFTESSVEENTES